MTDEPRRSGRSTKGQHKSLDMLAEPPTKRMRAKSQGRDKFSKHSAEPTPAPSEEEEIIRCICGEYEEEEDVERDMICCDRCSAWQHNDCMGLIFEKGEEPDQYFCEICKPENHKGLLDKIARGEKPWEVAAGTRRQQAQGKRPARRRKGKRGGRRGRHSEANAGTETEAEIKAETPPIAGTSPTSPVSAQPTATPIQEKHGVPKRNFDDHQETAEEESAPKPKQQKLSPRTDAVSFLDAKTPTVKADRTSLPPRQDSVVAEKPVAAVAKTPEEIPNAARRSAANALIKLFVDQVSEAQKRESFTLPDGKPAEEVAQQLGLSIENAMYQNLSGGSGEPAQAYKFQLRTILFNVKKNHSLRDRLLVGSLSPDTFSRMSTQDMASEELQQKDAEIKREAEKQHIIVQEQGPRIRRTHKGEELIEDESHNVATESIFSSAPAGRKVLDAEGSPPTQTPRSPKVQAQTESDSSRQASRPPSIDTKATTVNPHDHRVRSPGASNHDTLFPEVPRHIQESVPSGTVQPDAEIDHLLREEDESYSPPYSPKDYQEEGVVWQGKVIMNPVAEFSSAAKHVGGADLSSWIPWSQLLPPVLLVDGRIEVQLASNYLCGLRFSSSTDVSVVSVKSPGLPTERARFDKLFNYFSDRRRYGVIGKHPLPAVKDAYIVPVEAGAAKKPEFIELLENNTLEDSMPERVLLVVLVVKISDSTPSSVQPPSHHASPLTIPAATPQQPHLFTPSAHPSAQVSPTSQTALAGTPTNAYVDPRLQQPLHWQPQWQHQPSGPQQAPVQGLELAMQILGPQANSPVVQQVVRQAPNADARQLGLVRDILHQQPNAASSYDTLVSALVQATNNQQRNAQ